MVEPEKITLTCPKCCKQQEVLWFQSEGQMVKITGSTGSPSTKFFGKAERIEGQCECGYKFKPKDLDNF